MANIKEQYNRVKGAEWFPLLFKKNIIILGQGGIGSYLTYLLARIGANLYTFDMDIFEGHNMSGQLVRNKDVGKNKAVAIKDIVSEFSPDCIIETQGEYGLKSFSNPIVMCGFDNMKARKIAFFNWKKQLTSDNYKESFFCDGRLNAEQLQIFCISGDNGELIDRYEKEFLFDDSEVEDADCTFKQTSHSAMMIASFMVTFLTNWITNINSEGVHIRVVPFFYEYILPLHLNSSDDFL